MDGSICSAAINADSNGTMINTTNYPLLSQAEISVIPFSETNFSEAYIELYLGIGNYISMSYSKINYEGPCLPASYFIEKGRIEDTGQVEHLYKFGKKSVWNGSAQVIPASIFSVLKTGLTFCEIVSAVNTFAGYLPIQH